MWGGLFFKMHFLRFKFVWIAKNNYEPQEITEETSIVIEKKKVFAGFLHVLHAERAKEQVWRNNVYPLTVRFSLVIRAACTMYLTLGYRFDGSTRAERVIRGTKEDVVGCCVSNSRLFGDELAFVRGITNSKNTRYSSLCGRKIEKKTAKLVHLSHR